MTTIRFIGYTVFTAIPSVSDGCHSNMLRDLLDFLQEQEVIASFPGPRRPGNEAKEVIARALLENTTTLAICSGLSLITSIH